jgi:FtsP/CotA-like multicopper oxidase with cupredoxin domain
VLLRLIAAASSTNFYVDTGALEAEILAVDGKAVQPLKGNFFQLGIAQRLDLRVRIPKEGGAFPILADGEGKKLLAGVVLITEGATLPKLSREASSTTAALDNIQELQLRTAVPCRLETPTGRCRPRSGET